MVERPMRALVVDDEPAARRLLTSLLASEADVEVVGTCRHGGEALTWLRDRQADLLFLDIQMPELDGFQVLDALGESRPAVVFVTAFDAFAVRAFEAEAWDYLLKPFDGERLRQVLDRVRRRRSREAAGASGDRLGPLLAKLAADPSPEPADSAAEQPPLERLTVSHGRGRVTIRLSDVAYFQAESSYVRLHLSDASYLARVPLARLEARLDPRRFVRVHRSYLVQVDRIARLDPLGRGDLRLTLDDGRRLTASRRYRDRLERVLEPLP
ncbi:MAG: LytTR family DNA-binding domain-containing protein [Acidobacteriota bacterium]